MSARSKCSFSIEHILTVAGGKAPVKPSAEHFEWLHCTRYHPPKLQRQKKKETQRRNLGRNPRIPFSSSQVALLEAKFLQTPYLSSGDVSQLAQCLNLSDTRVKIWFQNRRARERRERDNPAGSSAADAGENCSPSNQDDDRTASPESHAKDKTSNTKHSFPQKEELIELHEKYCRPKMLFPISRNEYWRSVPIFLSMPPGYPFNPHQ